MDCQFAHILQGCSSGTGAIVNCPGASEVTLKDMGKLTDNKLQFNNN